MKKAITTLTLGISSLFISNNILAQPIASFSFATTNGSCTPDSVVFTNSSTGANFYIWDFGDFSPTDSSDDPYHWYNWQGVFIITLTAYDTLTGDSDIVTDIINIGYTPDPWWAWFNYSPFTPVCFGSTIDFTTFIWPTPDYYSWDFGDGDSASSLNTSHTYADTGTYVVTMIAGNSCGSDFYTDTIDVTTDAAPPWPSYSAWPNPVCPGTPVEFNDWSSPVPTSWEWSFGDGDTAFTQNTTHTYSAPGSYTLTFTVGNGCSDTTVISSITVDNSIIPSVWSWSFPDTVCPGDSVFFNSSGQNLVSYSWDFGDTNFSLQENPDHIYSFTGSYDVIFTGTNGCGNSNNDTTTVVVSNSAAPDSWFDYSPWSTCPTFSSICPGTAVIFTNWTDGGVSSLWDFGDGNTSTDTDPTHIYADTGNFTVKLVSTSSCGGKDSIEQCVRIVDDAVPSAFFCTNPSCFPSYTICIGGSVQFLNWSSDTMNCSWDFGDGNISNLVNPSHLYADTGSYIVTLTVTNACGNTSTAVDVINVALDGSGPGNMGFGTSPLSPCPGEQTWFWDFGFTGSAWYWDFDDGNSSTLQNPTHFYTAGGTYTVTFINYNSCSSDTAIMDITVKDGSIADFSYTSICLGDSVDFFDGSSLTPDTWAWDFGDGDTSTTQNPSHGFDSVGVSYNVSLTVTYNGCVTSISKTIVVGEILISSSQVNVTCNGADDGQATVTATGGTAPLTYLWNDPLAQTSTTATGLGGGTYSATVTDANGCIASDVVIINEPSAISISYVADTAAFGQDDGYINANVSGGTLPYTYSWSNGESTEDLDSIFAGTYTLTVTDSNGCMDSVSIVVGEYTGIVDRIENGDKINLYPNPVAGMVTISLELTEISDVEIVIYNILGERVVHELFLNIQNTEVLQDLSSFKNGIYLVEIRLKNSGNPITNHRVLRKKITVVR